MSTTTDSSTGKPRKSLDVRKSMDVRRSSSTKPRKSQDLSRTGPGSAYLDHRFRSNANTGPRPTPTIPDGGKWSVYAEVTIHTPPKYPYEAIVDIHSWREWNSWVPDVLVTKHSHPHNRVLKMEQGTFMTFTVQMTPTEKTTSKEVCQHLEGLKHRHDGNERHKEGQNITRIRWTLDNANLMTPAFIMKTERVNEIVEGEDDHTCTYRTWITFAGMAAKTVKKKYGEAVQARVVDFCQDLKERSETMYRKEQKDGKTNGVAS